MEERQELISRQAAIDGLKGLPTWLADEGGYYGGAQPPMVALLEPEDAVSAIENLPSAQPDLTEEDWKLIKKLRSFHNGTYAKALDKLILSAQQEPIRINLNESIKVKLTDWGKEIYYHQYDRTNQIAGREICKPMFPREDENGYTEFQLWCFIELYGMHMGMTMPNVIEPLEIVYER